MGGLQDALMNRWKDGLRSGLRDRLGNWEREGAEGSRHF